MARKKTVDPRIQEMVDALSGDVQGRKIIAEYICKLRKANDPHLELKTQIAKEAMKRLSVHDIEKFDAELEAMWDAMKEG